MDSDAEKLGRLTVKTFVCQPEVAHLADNAAVLPHILQVVSSDTSTDERSSPSTDLALLSCGD